MFNLLILRSKEYVQLQGMNLRYVGIDSLAAVCQLSCSSACMKKCHSSEVRDLPHPGGMTCRVSDSNWFVLLGNWGTCILPTTAAWLRLSHKSSNSVAFSCLSLHVLGIPTNCGLSGVPDGVSSSPPPPPLKSVHLFQHYLKNSGNLKNQYNSLRTTTKVRKLTTQKLTSWKICILLKNFVSC